MKPYYEDDFAVIYNGEALDVLRQMPAESADVVCTDPPYSSGGMFRADRAAEPSAKYRGWTQAPDGSSMKPKSEYGSFGGDSRDQRGFMAWCSAWQFQALRVTRAGGHCFTFTDWRQLPLSTDAIQAGGWTWRGIVVWDKGTGRPVKGRFRNHIEYVVWGTNGAVAGSDDYPSTLIAVPTVSAVNREHVTQKPADLIAHLLRVVPDRGAGRVVLDPFMGSGSTLVAAKSLGHRSIGIEVDERYCEIAARRLSSTKTEAA